MSGPRHGVLDESANMHCDVSCAEGGPNCVIENTVRLEGAVERSVGSESGVRYGMSGDPCREPDSL